MSGQQIMGMVIDFAGAQIIGTGNGLCRKII